MFSNFQCFFQMFFGHMGLFFPNRCTYLPCLPDHEITRSRSCSKMFCAQVFAWRNICGKLLKAASFVSSIVTSNIIAGIGVDRFWAHSRTISLSVDSLLDAADVDGEFCTATGTSKCTPPPQPHSFTQSLSELDFWIQTVKVLKNSTSCFFNHIPPPPWSHAK
jgi:hypothetical protein